jgi:type II secretory pathway pseudopilin PulG
MVAAVAIPCSFSARRSSNDASARQTLRNIASAQDSFARGPGRGNYANRLEDLRDWLDDSVIHAQRTPKNGYLLGELKTTPKTALAPATFSIDTFPAQTRGISRSGNSSFFIDQTADLRSSGISDERATVSSRKTGD